ncbi:aminoglycoside adenylyltransferase domain-containing protein [Neobacillus driksii]|uniref:aminoglycoside adenylyltransferase domain-containing protein n=1 Tax=Neobacillus driksii TaxID=3035913 RepID=UPI0027D8028E|nr:aminoglycoside adenylyltransferase domain-containing protein [Neobacillus niacini]
MTLSNFPTTISHLPNNVTEVLQNLLYGIQEAIGENLVGIYLRGSLALGDFDPKTSDIDFLVVINDTITEEKFANLSVFHSQLASFPNQYALDLEGAYIDLDALKRYRAGEIHPTIYRGGGLQWGEHRINWVLERWTVREHGITLIGPDPKKLIEPISVEELYSAVLVRLRDWVDYANQLDDPTWRLPLSHKAYVVETMCRVMFTLDCGDICSKPHAILWALETFPEPWRSLVERSQSWRIDNVTSPDVNIISEVMRFVHWVASKAGLSKQ